MWREVPFHWQLDVPNSSKSATFFIIDSYYCCSAVYCLKTVNLHHLSLPTLLPNSQLWQCSCTGNLSIDWRIYQRAQSSYFLATSLYFLPHHSPSVQLSAEAAQTAARVSWPLPNIMSWCSVWCKPLSTYFLGLGMQCSGEIYLKAKCICQNDTGSCLTWVIAYTFDRRTRERQEREELFMRRHEGAAVAIQMDTEAQMRGSIQTSKTVLQEAMDIGTTVLETMAKNREIFKVRVMTASWVRVYAVPGCYIFVIWDFFILLLLYSGFLEMNATAMDWTASICTEIATLAVNWTWSII